MDRRLVLGLVVLTLAALTAGCSQPGALELRAVEDDTDVADAASRPIDRDPRPSVVADRSKAEIVRGAIANGSVTVNSTAVSAPVERGRPFASEGAYYAINWTVSDERSANVVNVGIDYDATDDAEGQTVDARRQTVDYGDLPGPDREAIDGLLPRRVPPDGEGVDVGAGVIYGDDDLDASVLAPNSTYDAVRYEGDVYPISVDDPQRVDVATFEYAASRVARNVSAFAARVREASTVDLSGLPDGERSVVQTAVDDGGYYPESTDDEAFWSLIERLRDHDKLAGSAASGHWLVRYDGQLYVAEARYGQFLGHG